MLTDVEARGFGLSNAHKVQGGGAPPVVQGQYAPQPYNPAQSMPMQGQIPTQSFNAYGQQPQYPPQQQQSSGNDAQYGQDAGLRKEFDMLDVNKTGYIDKSDLQTLFMGKVSGTMLKR